METMHLMDTEAEEEEALCKGRVSVHDLTGVDDYLVRRANSLPLSAICEPCKALAVQWAAYRLLKLEADAGDLLAGAERLAAMASDCLKTAENHRRQVEKAERDGARYRNGAKRRALEAAELEEEASEYRQLIARLTKGDRPVSSEPPGGFSPDPLCVDALCVSGLPEAVPASEPLRIRGD